MGSVIGFASSAGASTGTIKYDAFGNVTTTTGTGTAIPSSVGTDFRYHGMQLDAASGLYHVRARTYDSKTGRFTSKDPVAGVMGRPETMNPYVFAHSSPTMWRDPTGNFNLPELMITVTEVGVLAALAVPSFVGFLKSAISRRIIHSIAAGRPLSDRDLHDLYCGNASDPEFLVQLATFLDRQTATGFGATAGLGLGAGFSVQLLGDGKDRVIAITLGGGAGVGASAGGLVTFTNAENLSDLTGWGIDKGFNVGVVGAEVSYSTSGPFAETLSVGPTSVIEYHHHLTYTWFISYPEDPLVDCDGQGP